LISIDHVRADHVQVSFKDPREAELISHRNKAERHVRVLAQRAKAQVRGLPDTSTRIIAQFELD
jgi:hypothetical protein